MIKFACGSCPDLHNETVVDFVSNGKFGFSSKQNMDRVVEDIDNFTELSFPMTTNPVEEDAVNAKFVPVIKYPGAVFITKDTDLDSRVIQMILDILNVWPIFIINILFMILTGGIIWVLVSTQ